MFTGLKFGLLASLGLSSVGFGVAFTRGWVNPHSVFPSFEFAVQDRAQAAERAPQLVTLVNFDRVNGAHPRAELIQGLNDDNFYGTTQSGGSDKFRGTMFRMTPLGQLTTMTIFSGEEGGLPRASLLQFENGSFYGTSTFYGKNVLGTIFRISPAGDITTLVNGAPRLASVPAGPLTKVENSGFYGTSVYGGKYSAGSIFRVTPEGKLTIVSPFTGANGAYPYSNLVKLEDGSLVGTTSAGGSSGKGTVFKVNPTTGVISTIKTFEGEMGSSPYSGVIKVQEETKEVLYGTTVRGGVYQSGTIFKITLEGNLTKLFDFKRTTGHTPYGRLLHAKDGFFYGVTSEGGKFNHGTIFRVSSKGNFTTLVNFNQDNGSLPYSGLMQARDGHLYGVTSAGGKHGWGTVYKLILN